MFLMISFAIGREYFWTEVLSKGRLYPYMYLTKAVNSFHWCRETSAHNGGRKRGEGNMLKYQKIPKTFPRDPRDLLSRGGF